MAVDAEAEDVAASVLGVTAVAFDIVTDPTPSKLPTKVESPYKATSLSGGAVYNAPILCGIAPLLDTTRSSRREAARVLSSEEGKIGEGQRPTTLLPVPNLKSLYPSLLQDSTLASSCAQRERV